MQLFSAPASFLNSDDDVESPVPRSEEVESWNGLGSIYRAIIYQGVASLAPVNIRVTDLARSIKKIKL